MKKPLAIQLEFDIKTVRRALALLSGEALSDEEINAKFFDRQNVKLDFEEYVGEIESFQMCSLFCALIIHNDNSQDTSTTKPKNRFMQKLDEAIERQEALKKQQNKD